MVLVFNPTSENRWSVKHGRRTVARITKGKDGYFAARFQTRNRIAIESVNGFLQDLNKPKRKRRIKGHRAVDWLEQLFKLEDLRHQ
jgi:hypothetical protein